MTETNSSLIWNVFLACIRWHENLFVENVNDKLLHFDSNFRNALARNAPIKTMKIRHRQVPFVDDEVKELMKNRNRLHKFARLTRMPADWEKYRALRDKVKCKLRQAEKDYVHNEIYNNPNIASMWKVIRNCVPRKETTKPSYSGDVKKLANEFNSFFTSVGINTSATALALLTEHGLPILNPPTSTEIPEIDQFYFHSVSCSEISRIVMSFSSNKAPGFDKVLK